MSDEIIKLFIADINKLSKNPEQNIFNKTFNKVETQGTVTKLNQVNGVLNIELTDLTGCLENVVFVMNNRPNKPFDCLVNTELKILHSLYNRNINNHIKVGDIIIIIGAMVSGVFHVDQLYKTTIVNNYVWTEEILNLYKTHYKAAENI